jgi:6-phosphofructokinase 1
VDNDLAVTDCCPGFGSVAKYTAVSLRECALDVMSMMDTSTKVFVMEVMGRHAGWIAASAGLASEGRDDAPHIILFPELEFDEDRFLARVCETVDRVGCCVVAASEGIKYADGKFVADAHAGTDAFGHTQLGGVAPALAGMVRDRLKLKTHWALPDYLQRSARHIASKTDLEQAFGVGKAAVELALTGRNAVMPVIKRTSDTPYRWTIATAKLDQVANREKKLPRSFITRDGFHITAAARRYLAPLIRGEAPPPYGKNGLPEYVTLRNVAVKKKLPAFAM